MEVLLGKWRDVIYEDLPSETKKLLKFWQKRKKKSDSGFS
jgi:hypothetical protein